MNLVLLFRWRTRVRSRNSSTSQWKMALCQQQRNRTYAPISYWPRDWAFNIKTGKNLLTWLWNNSLQLLKQQKNHIGQKTELFNVKTCKNLTKAELLQEDILRHLFICQRRFSNEKVGNRKNWAHFYYISFKSWTLGGLSFFNFQLIYW